MTNNEIFIPLETAESAALNTNTLLPKAVYEQLADFISKAIKNLPGRNVNLNDSRSHNAISIDGARGTGKTSILVNLKRFLEHEHIELLDDIHILDPIDPTLLETGESLFLHVLVAAVLHDREVKEAQRQRPEQARVLQHRLEKLANGLESVETQNDQHGMDKVRALYGNKHLADCVQDFFCGALDLLGKKLLILPIDDVDTSLNRAFENLEIIRRYLTTPYALPIVSGDRSLYSEVTWRDFYGRLIKDSTYKKQQAYVIAEELANEYQRKILPLPRRLTMPTVSDYWSTPTIKLRGKTGDVLPLQNFYAWLETFISGPVNGLENSLLSVPIPSIRALSQLINHCGDLVASLPESICKSNGALQVYRSWQLPSIPLDVIETFHNRHQELGKERKREYSEAYRLFYDRVVGIPYSSDFLPKEYENKWARRLAEYFRFEPEAGPVYLSLLAKIHWQQWTELKSTRRSLGVFDTPLFQPLKQTEEEFEIFDKNEDLSSWPDQLQHRLPGDWLAKVKNQKTILPYPVAEVGINSAINWKYWNAINGFNLEKELQGKAFLLVSLLTQHNFYTKSRQTMMLNVGRIFEIIISSLVGPMELEDLQRLVLRAPFFSTSALAPTKSIEIQDKFVQEHIFTRSDDRPVYVSDAIEESLIILHQEIMDWRSSHELENFSISPWLTYKVFNKVFSQIASAELIPNGMQDVGRALKMTGMVFYTTWSAFGSFEKGKLFGLPDVVATVNLNSPQNFENNDHYRMNVGPFSPTSAQSEDKEGLPYKHRREYGRRSRTASYLLADHPLRLWIDSMPIAEDTKASRWLLDELGYSTHTKRLEDHHIYSKLADTPIEEIAKLQSEMREQFPNTRALHLLEQYFIERCDE